MKIIKLKLFILTIIQLSKKIISYKNIVLFKCKSIADILTIK